MIQVSALASGSNGNCYYIGNQEDAILVDAGISCKQITLRMQNLNLDISKVRGIFITHEHSDHTRGAEVFSKKYNIPVFITKKTYDHSKLQLLDELIKYISLDKKIKINNFLIYPFPKLHDAVEPCSYSIELENKIVSVLTDIGDKCDNVVEAIRKSHILFLESNYDLLMLENGPYPPFLKQRISGGFGHLSNNKAGALLTTHASTNLSHVFLSHLSENNNCPKKAMDIFHDIVSLRNDLSIRAIMTDRYKETPLLNIE